jgi:predicted lipid carrier protein YhbT
VSTFRGDPHDDAGRASVPDQHREGERSRKRRDAILGDVASTSEVEQSLQSLIQSLASANPEPGSVPDRTIVCVVPDIEIAYRAALRDARLRDLEPVAIETEADVRITARSDDLVALIQGRLNAPLAFLTGKIRIDASSSDLMMIRQLF